MKLTDLLWDDILFKHVLPRVHSIDLVNMHEADNDFKLLVEAYIVKMEELNFAPGNKNGLSKAKLKIFYKCSNLKKINLAGLKMATDDLLLPILKKNKMINYLNLNNCPNLSAAVLQPVILNCKELRVLKLARCQWLTSGAIEALTLHHNLIEAVDFSYCTKITRTSLVLFLKKFPNLKGAHLQGMPCVDDSIMAFLAKNHRGLVALNVDRCPYLTFVGINFVQENCTKLKNFSATLNK